MTKLNDISPKSCDLALICDVGLPPPQGLFGEPCAVPGFAAPATPGRES